MSGPLIAAPAGSCDAPGLRRPQDPAAPQGHFTRRDGYLILLLALAMFALWGLNLFALSETEVTAPSPAPALGNGTGEITTLSLSPRPFIYFYLREAGFDPEVTARVPEDLSGLLVVAQPPGKVDPAFARELFAWVDRGGRLLLMTSRDHPLARMAGVEIEGTDGAWSESLAVDVPAYRDVRAIRGSGSSVRRRGGAGLFTPFDGSDRHAVGVAGRGAGSVHVVAAPDLFTAKGLARLDNIVFVTRLVERLARGTGRVRLWHPFPERSFRLRARVGPVLSMRPNAKRKEPYLSLWSLIKANAVSLALLQILLGLGLYTRTLARQPAAPLPAPGEPVPADSFAEGMARLYERRGSPDYLAGRLRRELLAALRRRFGAHEGSPSALLAEVAAVDPGLADRSRQLLTGLEPQLTRTGAAGEGSPGGRSLLDLAAGVDAIRKERKSDG